MRDRLRTAVNRIVTTHAEERMLLRFVEELGLPAGHRILDVGCGFGGKMRSLIDRGFNVVGVDIREETVAANRRNGLPCFIPSELQQFEIFDLLIFSHILEHLLPGEMVVFMESYLNRLAQGGHVLIATPVLAREFYDDADHVRPYPPGSILMVFGGEAMQTRHSSNFALSLRRIWFRRSPFRFDFLRFHRTFWPVAALNDVICGLLFHGSFGIIGRRTGWMGLFSVCRREQA